MDFKSYCRYAQKLLDYYRGISPVHQEYRDEVLRLIQSLIVQGEVLGYWAAVCKIEMELVLGYNGGLSNFNRYLYNPIFYTNDRRVENYLAGLSNFCLSTDSPHIVWNTINNYRVGIKINFKNIPNPREVIDELKLLGV